MHKFTQRYASCTIPTLSTMFPIFPIFKFEEFFIYYRVGYMHWCSYVGREVCGHAPPENIANLGRCMVHLGVF